MDDISIDIGGGRKLVAEPNSDCNYKEIFIGVRDAHGQWLQDIAIVGLDSKLDEHDEFEDDPDNIRVLLFENPDRDTPTRCESIPIYKEDDNG